LAVKWGNVALKFIADNVLLDYFTTVLDKHKDGKVKQNLVVASKIPPKFSRLVLRPCEAYFQFL